MTLGATIILSVGLNFWLLRENGNLPPPSHRFGSEAPREKLIGLEASIESGFCMDPLLRLPGDGHFPSHRFHFLHCSIAHFPPGLAEEPQWVDCVQLHHWFVLQCYCFQWDFAYTGPCLAKVGGFPTRVREGSTTLA